MVRFFFKRVRACALLLGIAASAAVGTAPAAAEALLLVEADSGKVLHAENATYPWYPASVTKIMTAYVTLRAVKERRIALDKLLKVSPYAAAQQPSKMGFAAGTNVTVDNALKMLMVKSANDMSVVLAEGVSGSVEKFADDMNRHARRLGMTQSSFVNPNGLPAEDQVTSARDMAILARAIIREFPEHDFYWNIPAIRFGKKVMRNYNSLIGRYPGADGMKTGFICASGFNVVASATRDGKRLIAVVLGAPSSSVRAYKAAQMLERGFGAGILSWLAPSLGHVDSLPAIDAAPPNLREDMCGKNRKRPAAEDSEDEESAQANGTVNSSSQFAVFLSQLRAPNSKPSELLGPPAAANPIVVHVGPPKQAPAKQLATAPRQGSSRPASRADVAAVGAGPVTAFAPSTLAASEPETTTRAAAVVPTPRPRPKVNAKPANR